MTKTKKEMTTESEFFKKIDELIDQQLKLAKGLNLKNHLEQSLSNALTWVALAIFKDTYELTDLSKLFQLVDLTFGYTKLAGVYIQPEDVVPCFIAHLKYRRKKDATKNSDDAELSVERIQKMRDIMNRPSALPSEVALLFRVERRQVRRWIERGDLKKGRDGKIQRDEYMKFSQESAFKKYGREEYGRVAVEFSKMKFFQSPMLKTQKKKRSVCIASRISKKQP